MNIKKSISTFLLISAMTLVLAACADKQKPADQAITAADSALDAVSEDAKQYVPQKYNEVLAKVNALKIAYNRGNYDSVIADAPAAMTAVKGLADVAAAGKAEGMKSFGVEWETLSVSVPKYIEDVQNRGAALENSKKQPEGINLVSARRAIADANARWKQAEASGKEGRMEAAVVNAKKAQQRAEAAAAYLLLPPPPKPQVQPQPH